MRLRLKSIFAWLISVAATAACTQRPMDDQADAGPGTASSHAVGEFASDGASATAASAHPRPRFPPLLSNPIAYIPPQCFTRTTTLGTTKISNPCYTCHTRSESPNETNDDALQRTLSFPPIAAENPWTNLFDPPVLHAGPTTDGETLAYVRRSNYFDDQGKIALNAALDALPPGWDTDGNGRWDGYRPDVWFSFDDHGFDHQPDGTLSGWRAFAYYPFLGTFFPTNGSADDVLVRLDPVLRKNEAGVFDRAIYEVNLAIVEALITRSDVRIDATDERALGVDLDLDGHLATATRVAFDAAATNGEQTRMHYVGLAHANEGKGTHFPLAVGLFPMGTEFFHTVRYLDVGADGAVTMAPRMKEVRYARKVRWFGYAFLRGAAKREAKEEPRTPNGTHEVRSVGDLGILEKGWLFQGFIEDEHGALRPQSYEETVYCDGCHGGIGATTDNVFSFARKLSDDSPARGWFHWSQHGLRGIPEPKRTDGAYEYSLYLAQAGAGDELRENTEVIQRFFDERHALRAPALEHLHHDLAYLLWPSPSRALALDRAYRAIVEQQSFDKGREPVLAVSRNVYRTVPVGGPTGVATTLVQARLARPELTRP